MKKIAAIVLFGFLAMGMNAQGLDLGIKAGVNFASISDATEASNRTGFVAGFFTALKFSEKVGLQVDLLYSQQGADLDVGAFDLDYINIPALLKYYFTDRLNIQLGPQFGFLINDETRTLVDEVIQDVQVNNFDLDGVVGLGYDFLLGIRAEARYQFGFSDVLNEGDGRNQVFTLMLGYSFL